MNQNFVQLNSFIGIHLYNLFNRVFHRVADVFPAQEQRDYLNNPLELVLVL